jgi:hypothetical protein
VFLYLSASLINKNTLGNNKARGIMFCVFGLAFAIASQTVFPLLA